MNALDVLHYGHESFLKSLGALDQKHWALSGVCGQWSVIEIIIHLTSYEQLLSEVLSQITGNQRETPMMEALFANGDQFNDIVVAQGAHKSAQTVFTEFRQAYDEALMLAKQVSPAKLQETGTIPWYGEQYSLDDFLVYAFYGHKREHGAQIDVFRDLIDGKSAST